jgi:hypothetical protein
MHPHLSLALVLLAAAPGDEPTSAAPVVLTVGRVLVLENEGVLEGDVECVGDQYRVRRGQGETWVRGEQVLRLCRDHEDAYAFLRTRANLDDPDERLRLARWCRQYGLRRQALEEVQAAAQLRPEHAETRRLLNGLLQAAAASPPAPPAEPRPETPAPPPVDVSADCVAQFTTRVQPILMNACAGCHINSRSAFHLQRCYDVGANNRKALQQNLSAVAAQINFAQPTMSPLLIKAVSTHCETMTRAPLRDRQAAAYVTLQEWVKRTVANNPHLAPHAVEPPVQVAETKPTPAEPTPLAAPRPVEVAPPPAAAPPAPKPTVSPNIIDVVDPEMFNREHHPERYSGKP